MMSQIQSTVSELSELNLAERVPMDSMLILNDDCLVNAFRLVNIHFDVTI